MEWVSVDDRLPEYGCEVLGYIRYETFSWGIFIVHLSGFDNDKKPMFSTGSYMEVKELNNWQPLPEPPKGEA